jgi:hypothetical protein
MSYAPLPQCYLQISHKVGRMGVVNEFSNTLNEHPRDMDKTTNDIMNQTWKNESASSTLLIM